jgi:AraC family transcriptional regulator
MEVQIRTMADTRVAYMRTIGPYGGSGIPRTWQRFAAWCAQRGLMQPRRTMYGVCPDDPAVTPPQRCRYDTCIEVGDDFAPSGEIGVQQIAGGRYACAQFAGTPDQVPLAWGRLMSEWMPTSGYEPDDRATFELYGKDFAIDEQTGAFSCQLCMPVRPV